MTLKSMFTSKTRLSDALRLGMKKSAFEKTPYTFLPQSALDSIIIEDIILMALGITKPTPEDCKLVAYILTKAKRLFATAAYVGLPSDTLYCAMVLFRNANFSDERLPLEEMGGEDFLKNKMNGLKHPLVKLEGHLKPNAERIWTFSRIHDFLKAQFSFLTPIFSTGKIDYDFGPSLILPFLKHTAQGEGSFGVVSRIEIHADHIKPTPKTAGSFAIKEIKSNNDSQEVAEHWESEVKALRTMNELRQDHIIRFIAAFRRGRIEAREHYIIFEWADGGNLHELWQSDPSQPVTGTLVREAITQLHGLATALSAAHYLASDRAHGRSYRHGDLKPANILRFDSGTVIGTLKIGDWGEAKSHQTVTAMRNMDTTARYGTRRYEPPECEIGIGPTDLNQRAKGRSRLYDIWSMGCITLEFIIWLLYGATGLREFNDSVTTGSGDQSPFYEVNEACGVRSARVHSVVASWMQHMSKDPACRAGETALGDLLELVERGLLAVNLPSHGGSKDLLLIHDSSKEYR
ncbi:hypothetical protein N0V91_000238 [Didymella pomorum]|uniref:Protein kinase domain-containing protein n=1 Tax=Didymella pomorum TaxID=749634 RepID=A0A9W9DCY7_9PLEO|nr:hypothetical protein N0V91_000238 [Didymella pomorum]